MFEVKINPEINIPATNIGFTEISEYTKGLNFKLNLEYCDSNPKNVEKYLKEKIAYLEELYAQHSKSFTKVIIFHRDNLDKKQIFALPYDKQIGTPIHWLD